LLEPATANVMENRRVSFEKIALPYAETLYRVAFRWTNKSEDASDLVQDTYLRAFQNFDSFREGTNCKAWLFTIMYSIFVNQYRRKQKEGPLMSDTEIEQKYYASLNDKAKLDSNMSWLGPEVEHALSELPEIFRSPILLVDANGFTYEEAAQILNCPVGTVRSRLFRARKILYVSLKKCAQNMGYITKKNSES
jgi:RNA polymerase sigma-70 factor (ECF subfamily)